MRRLTETEQDCENVKDLWDGWRRQNKTVRMLKTCETVWRRQNKTVRMLKTCETADGDRHSHSLVLSQLSQVLVITGFSSACFFVLSQNIILKVVLFYSLFNSQIGCMILFLPFVWCIIYVVGVLMFACGFRFFQTVPLSCKLSSPQRHVTGRSTMRTPCMALTNMRTACMARTSMHTACMVMTCAQPHSQVCVSGQTRS